MVYCVFSGTETVTLTAPSGIVKLMLPPSNVNSTSFFPLFTEMFSFARASYPSAMSSADMDIFSPYAANGEILPSSTILSSAEEAVSA